MKELSIREMQERQLCILDYVADFCVLHDIEYMLAGGALLGAFREGKLIPWDDDIDLFMARDDYRRFIVEFQDTDCYKLLDSSRVEEYYYPFAKVCDRRTVMVENVESIGLKALDCLGVGIDVFPIDRLPSSKGKASALLLQHKALQGLCYRDYRYADKKTMSLPMRLLISFYKTLRGFNFTSVQDCIKEMDSIWSRRYTGDEVVDTWFCQRFSFDSLFPVGSIELEGKEYAAPGHCEKFLRECYGPDYMIPRNTQPDGHGVAYLI